MASDNKSQGQRTPQEDLECHYASRQIEQTDYLYPEFRLELVDGKFLVGGMLDGSRWLLKEALIGWGLESAIAFASLDLWWEALRLAHDLPHRSPDEWLTWAEDLPIDPNYRENWWPPLGSRYLGEHHWVRNQLRNSLSAAVSQAALGSCFGPNYGMQVGQHMFTPDVLMVGDVRLAENILHDCYIEDVADLVIEIVLPEKADIDEGVRRQYYEQGAVPHYWVVNPITQQTQFWEWSTEGYQVRSLDADGCYRGVAGLTFSPQLLWSTDEKLPAFTSIAQPRRWRLAYEVGEEVSWGSVPFEPVVDLTPSNISVEQFIAWCPETKLEGGPFPLIGGQTGTRNAIAMLLMSVGSVETVRLMPGYEWVRVLRRIERNQRQDTQQHQVWWSQAQAIAQQLHNEHGVGGVGVIGDLIKSKPLHVWSEIQLVLWDVPERFSRGALEYPSALPLEMTEVEWATPAQWQEICQQMVVLVGRWHEQKHPRSQKRLQFRWLNSQ
ncbi:MAG: Uma2 family endonuclease [Lyngbya sp. HA4199-MV5]|jgi:Uma2 family endonuclease|nr:Uma2 family endonuclease [Lyngbya sp. HA4199-MV5]